MRKVVNEHAQCWTFVRTCAHTNLPALQAAEVAQNCKSLMLSWGAQEYCIWLNKYQWMVTFGLFDPYSKVPKWACSVLNTISVSKWAQAQRHAETFTGETLRWGSQADVTKNGLFLRYYNILQHQIRIMSHRLELFLCFFISIHDFGTFLSEWSFDSIERTEVLINCKSFRVCMVAMGMSNRQRFSKPSTNSTWLKLCVPSTSKYSKSSSQLSTQTAARTFGGRMSTGTLTSSSRVIMPLPSLSMVLKIFSKEGSAPLIFPLRSNFSSSACWAACSIAFSTKALSEHGCCGKGKRCRLKHDCQQSRT